MTTFADLGVPDDLVATLGARGIDAPFPIQSLALPDSLAGRDVCGRAHTGSGKTLAFGIPLVARLGRASAKRPMGLVLVPTRELAAQVRGEIEWLGARRRVRVSAVYGGVGFGPQLQALRRGVDVLVACPGRLADLIERGEVRLDAVEMVVVDEADRMADMGFLPVVRAILDRTPATRQTLLFSATLDGVVDSLVQRYQRDPVRHTVPDEVESASLATHFFWRAAREERVQLTADIIRNAGPTIVFCKTKHGTDKLARHLERTGARVQTIHGNRSQAQRERALAAFGDGAVDALLATDVAARGIHVDAVACVVHFDLPHDARDYTHRAGRTARAGAAGTVITLVDRGQERDVRRLQRELGVHGDLSEPNCSMLAAKASDPVPPSHKAEPSVPAAPLRSSSPSGVVKWFDSRRGFGFIAGADGSEVFVHHSAIESEGRAHLREGQRVAFVLGRGRRGDEAREVRLLAG